MRKRIDRYCGKDFTPLWMYNSIEDVTLGNKILKLFQTEKHTAVKRETA